MGYYYWVFNLFGYATKQNVLTNEFATTHQEFLVLKMAEDWVSIIKLTYLKKPTLKEYQT